MRQRYILYLILIAILLAGFNCKSIEVTKREPTSEELDTMFEACKNGNIEKMKELISSGLDINMIILCFIVP